MTTLIIAGLVTGCIYAISALGLVLTFVSSRVFNFAHGALGLFVAWCFYEFNTGWGWSVPAAAIVSIGLIGPLLGLLLWAVLFRKLAAAPAVVRLAATIGLYVVIPPVILLVFGAEVVYRPTGLAGGSSALIDVLGVNLNPNQVTVVAVALVVALGMGALLRYTTFGLLMRGSVDAPSVAALHGTNTELVSAGTWMIGSMLAGLAGVLLIPFLGLETIDYTLATIASFAAVVIGRMRSLPVTFLGALVLGLVQELSVLWLPEGSLLTGLRTALPFLLMVVALIVYNFWRPERRDPERIALVPISVRTGVRSGWRRLLAPAIMLILLLVVPAVLRGFWVGLLAAGLALGVIFLSYTVITGMGAMISLGQLAFAGVGALTAAELSANHGWPVLLAILLGGVVAALFGMLIALPAMRWGGLLLALGTLAFGFLVDNLIFKLPRFDNHGAGLPLDRPAIGGFVFDSDRAFFYVALVVFALGAAGVLWLRGSTTGMLFGAIRASERATASIGFSVFRAKLTLFAVSAFIAGVGGGLYASYLGRAAAPSFSATVGLVLLAVIVTIGTRSVVAAAVAGIAFSVMPQLFSFYLPAEFQNVPAILFGLGAIGLASEPRGAVVQVTEAARRLRARLTRSEPTVPDPPPSSGDLPGLVAAGVRAEAER